MSYMNNKYTIDKKNMLLNSLSTSKNINFIYNTLIKKLNLYIQNEKQST